MHNLKNVKNTNGGVLLLVKLLKITLLQGCFSRFLNCMNGGTKSRNTALNKEISGFFNVALTGLLNFSQFMKKNGELVFLNISLGCTIISHSLKSLQIGRMVFQAKYVCRREKGVQYMIKVPVFKKKKCSHLYYNFVSV